MVAVPDDVGELCNPVTQDQHSRFFSKLEVDLNMAVAINEIVDVGVILDVFLREAHEMFAVLTHIGRLLVIVALQATVLGPVQTEPQAPTGMEGREGPLTGTVVEDALKELEAFVGIAQSVAMRQEEYLTIEFGGLGLLVEDDATLLFQITIGPDVVVACEKMHLDAHVSEFGEFAQKAGKALGHHIFVLVPEVEHIAQEIDGSSFFLDAVKETHEPTLLHALMRDSQ